jgi:hypothetical protein
MEGVEDIWLPQWPQGYKPSYSYNKPTFEKHVGISGKTWLIPAVTRLPNRGDHIYVTAYVDPDKFGSGFGGRTLHMPLITGGEFALNGGWHANSRALLEDTGIDCTKQHLTYGAVGVHRIEYMTIYGVIWQDTAPQIGEFTRVEKKAQEIANERNETVIYSVISLGGGSSGYKEVTT